MTDNCCVKCKHHYSPPLATGDEGAMELLSFCRHESTRAERSPVTGHSSGLPCLVARSVAGACGPEGRLWEAANEGE
jgi:hypothetical protein